MARCVLAVLLLISGIQIQPAAQAGRTTIPRTGDGRPNLQGIWQVRNRASYDLQDHVAGLGMPAGRGVVEGGEIPYQPWALKKKQENFAGREAGRVGRIDKRCDIFCPHLRKRRVPHKSRNPVCRGLTGCSAVPGIRSSL